MTGCRPGQALAVRWRNIERQLAIEAALSGDEIVDRTKTEADRAVPTLKPLLADLAALRELSGDSPDDFVFRTPSGGHWVETDWRNFRSRHFVAALERVEAEWERWREGLADTDGVRESIAGLAKTRPTTLGATLTRR